MKKGLIFFLTFIFAAFIAKNSFETVYQQNVSTTFVSKTQNHLHKAEKVRHKRKAEKFVKINIPEENFRGIDNEIITAAPAVSAIAVIFFMFKEIGNIFPDLPEIFCSSKKYLVLRNIRI